MLFLKTLLAGLVVVSILATLPTATHCDTSYYEKYYSARRFLPLKRNSLLQYNFSVNVAEQSLQSFEHVALVGDLKQLGAWRADNAILLNRSAEHNVWTGTVQLPINASVSYRYFIAAVDMHNANGGKAALQIRRWESHITARQFNTSTLAGNRSDIFGRIVEGAAVESQRGWLNAGRIVQFKLFRNPLQLNESRQPGEQLHVKLQAIEPHSLVPILPSARASTEYVRMTYGASFLHAQPEFGVPYAEHDILIFHSMVSELRNVAYLLKLYATQANSDLVRLIGYQYIYTETLQGSEGNLTLNLISPVWLHTIGSLNLQYLVIAPLPASENSTAIDFRTTFVDYWRSNWQGLDVGHRGLGRSLKQSSASAPAITENTVASMKASGDLGADLVEFDVMLTSDFVPIIYHDYMVYVCMDPKKPTSKDDLTAVLIKDVTYEQLKNLKTYQVVGSKIIEYAAHNTVEQEDHRLFPLFEEFLTKVNKTVGFDIEIKWPQLRTTGALESVQTIDKNLYVDRILDVMLRHGCGRLSFFTSFDADICTLLRFKQNMYPVMFLTSGTDAYYADPRSDTNYDAINNAQAFDLAGIVPNSAPVLKDPNWIQLAAKQHKKVFVWGDDLKDVASIAWFKQQAPTGMIYDRLDLWLPYDKQSVFGAELDLPEFFQLQCPTVKPKSERNTTIDSILSNVNML